MGVKRFAPVLVVLSALAVLSPAAGASADKGNRDLAVFDATFGGTISKFAGVRKWQPSLWLDATWGAAGPLHLGAYFQWIGKSFPLDDPGFGGGGLIALRWNVKNLRVSGAFTGGYLGVPLPDRVQGAGTIGAFAGLGYGFLSWMGFEARGRWMRYFNMPSGAPNHAWTVEAGFSFFVK
ncbi:MAG: hypothetical protein EP303_05255 [Deltaproteobacteria bacterium]|nr:MAG: hypothetical protein EP303_05255 [Deltaproteobacteria bacterium]UCF45702.1 MAG: hypothetical protein JSU89_00575 [Myxococcales bacterium]